MSSFLLAEFGEHRSWPGAKPALGAPLGRLRHVPAAFLVAQISDPHIGADWDGEDPLPGLRQVVAAVLALPNRPDAVLLTGDLTDHGDPAEYATVRELVEPIGAPVHAIAGNHDDRGALRAAFALPGADAEPVQWSADLGPLRLIGLDTTIPGSDAGALDAERLRWARRGTGAGARPTHAAGHAPSPHRHRSGAVGRHRPPAR